jgi:hypothetical protein
MPSAAAFQTRASRMPSTRNVQLACSQAHRSKSAGRGLSKLEPLIWTCGCHRNAPRFDRYFGAIHARLKLSAPSRSRREARPRQITACKVDAKDTQPTRGPSASFNLFMNVFMSNRSVTVCRGCQPEASKACTCKGLQTKLGVFHRIHTSKSAHTQDCKCRAGDNAPGMTSASRMRVSEAAALTARAISTTALRTRPRSTRSRLRHGSRSPALMPGLGT